MGSKPHEIRQDIMRTRGEIEDTVDAISYKADVPSRMKEAVADKVDDVRTAFSSATQKMSRAVSERMPDRAQVRKVVDDVAGNPAALVVGAVIAGALIGMALPGGRRG